MKPIQGELSVSRREVLLRKLSSRKFWAMIAAILMALAGLVSDQATFLESMAAITAAVAAYQLGEGLADSGRRA